MQLPSGGRTRPQPLRSVPGTADSRAVRWREIVPTREAAPSGHEGFTLAEVLVATVILAVGLLALSSLGMVSARTVARAERQSEYATAASDTLERVLGRIRDRQPVDGGRTFVRNGDTVRIAIDSVRVATADGAPVHRFDVTVTVAPTPREFTTRADSLRVVGSVVR